MTSKYGFKVQFQSHVFDDVEQRMDIEGLLRPGSGPIVLMIENYRSGFLWQLMRRCPYIIKGLRRAGFAGGWLMPPP
jgi:hypothetical protein